MVGGAAEPRLQATHRDRCTDSRARMSPRGVDSLVSSLVAREGRPAAAGQKRRLLAYAGAQSEPCTRSFATGGGLAGEQPGRSRGAVISRSWRST